MYIGILAENAGQINSPGDVTMEIPPATHLSVSGIDQQYLNDLAAILGEQLD